MKMIVAIIRPENLEAVQAALNERDGTSNAMSDCFDLNQQPLPPPR